MNIFFSIIKKYKNKILLSVIIGLLLLASYNMDSNNTDFSSKSDYTISDSSAQMPEAVDNKPDENILQSDAEKPAEISHEITSINDDGYNLSENTVLSDSTLDTDDNQEKSQNVCYISISCASILKRMEKLPSEKHSLVPQNGMLFAKSETEFKDGESVFELLKRITRENKIHMEFNITPIYNSAYIEGIGNLYEFDCGELSGWTYKVNGSVPGYSCSEYIIKTGDNIEWLYTCDMGRDI